MRLELVGVAEPEKIRERGHGGDAPGRQHFKQHASMVNQVGDMHDIRRDFVEQRTKNRRHGRLVVRILHPRVRVPVLVDGHHRNAVEFVTSDQRILRRLAWKHGGDHDGIVPEFAQVARQFERVGLSPVEMVGKETVDEQRDLHAARTASAPYSRE